MTTETLNPRYIVFLLSFANVLAYLDRYIMAAVLPSVQLEMGLSNFAAGMLVSAFLLGSLPLMPIFGHLGDRMNRITLMFTGVMGWTIATALSALAPGYATLFLARVAVGCGEASFLPNAPATIKAISENLIKANGRLAVYHISVPLGSALGIAVGGYFAQHYGWRSAFYCGAVLGLPVAFMLYLARGSVPHLPVKNVEGNFLSNLKMIFSYANYRRLVIGFALLSFILSGFITWIPKLGVSRGFAIKDVTSKFGLVTLIAAILGNMLGGYFGPRYAGGEPTITSLSKFSRLTAALSFPLVCFAFQMIDMNMTMLMLLIGEILIFAAIAPTLTAILAALPSHLAATGVALALFAVQCIGSLTAPIVIGALADAMPLADALSLSSVCALLASAIWWRIR